MKDYPKPNIEVLSSPKLDEDAKKQIEKLRSQARIPAMEWNLQKQILNMSGPLT